MSRELLNNEARTWRQINDTASQDCETTCCHCSAGVGYDPDISSNAIHAAMKPGRLLHLRLGDGGGLTAVWHGTWEPIARDAKVQFDSELLVDHETGWQDGLQRNTCQDDCLHSGTLRC